MVKEHNTRYPWIWSTTQIHYKLPQKYFIQQISGEKTNQLTLPTNTTTICIDIT